MNYMIFGAAALPDAISEWWNNTMQSVLGGMYNGLYEKCEDVFGALFLTINDKITWASSELTKSPQAWNNSAFLMVKNIAENALIPIASCILTFIFCWQLIQMMQDSNRMQNIRPDTILMELLKLAVCMLACSKSFQIVMGFWSIASYATSKVAGSSTGSFGTGKNFSDVLTKVTSNYSFGDVLDALLALIVLLISWFLIMAVGAIIYVRVNLWYMELLLYAAAAPIPYATFGNKEWGQMGMNYTRKMLAICFEGFFMLLAFALFGAVLGGIGGDFYEYIVMVIAAGFALCMILFKAGNIASSVFNAH